MYCYLSDFKIPVCRKNKLSVELFLQNVKEKDIVLVPFQTCIEISCITSDIK